MEGFTQKGRAIFRAMLKSASKYIRQSTNFLKIAKIGGMSKGEFKSFISALVLGETVYWFEVVKHKNSNSFPLLGVRLGSSGTALHLHRFLNKMDLNFGTLVESDVGHH